MFTLQHPKLVASHISPASVLSRAILCRVSHALPQLSVLPPASLDTHTGGSVERKRGPDPQGAAVHTMIYRAAHCAQSPGRFGHWESGKGEVSFLFSLLDPDISSPPRSYAPLHPILLAPDSRI